MSASHRSFKILFLVFILFFSAALFGQQSPVPLPAGVQYVTTVEGISEYRLQNGLRVLLFPDPTKTNITVNLTYLVGSRHEDYGETGMAHLLEHLMFMGSKNHANIKKELDDHGSQPNGSASFDRTNYFETFRATDENLKWALEMEADRMVNSFILNTLCPIWQFDNPTKSCQLLPEEMGGKRVSGFRDEGFPFFTRENQFL